MMRILFSMVVSFSVFWLHSDDSFDLATTRGHLSEHETRSIAGSITILSPTFLGSTTTSLCNCGKYSLSKSISYTTSSTSGCPMIRIIGGGVNLNLEHNCACFSGRVCSSAVAGSHGVGIEVGYSPNALGSNAQPTSVVIENGIMCDWDVAILIHAGVKDVTIRNMVFTGNVLPIVIMAQDDNAVYPATPNLTSETTNITLENITIVGGNFAGLSCLKWINSYLSSGLSLNGGPVASTTVATVCGYSSRAVIPTADSPTNDILAGASGTGALSPAYVYTGIYGYGISNLKMSNIDVSNIGYDQAVSGIAENTVAYGIYLRNVDSASIEKTSSTDGRSSQSVVGLYVDNADVLSLTGTRFTDNHISFINSGATSVNTPEKIWAAGIVLCDSSRVKLYDVIVSNTFGYDNAWGIRTILFNKSKSNNFNFLNILADGLAANNVYGIDLGDLYKKTSGTGTRIASGSVRNVELQAVSVSSAQGKLAETTVAQEFKGIYLGDNSTSVSIKSVDILGNDIAAGSTGQNSGIEFGSSSITASSVSALAGLSISNISCMNNGKLVTSVASKFCGIRGVTGGATNVFKNITIENGSIQDNSGDGIRIANAAGVAGGSLQGATIKNCNLSNNYSSIHLNSLSQSILSSLQCNNNTGSIPAINILSLATDIIVSGTTIQNNISSGILVAGAVTKCIIKESLISDNGSYGIRFASTATDLIVDSSKVLRNISAGLSIVGLASLLLIQCSHFDDNGDAGISLTSCTGLSLSNVKLNGNRSTAGSVSGLSVSGASSGVSLKKVLANNNNTTLGSAIGLSFAAVTNLVMKGVQASSNIGTLGSYGIYLSGIIQGFVADAIEASNNEASVTAAGTHAAGIYISTQLLGASLKKIIVNNNRAGERAYGMYMANATGVELSDFKGCLNASVYSGASLGFYQAAGLFINQGGSVRISEIYTDFNTQSQMAASALYVDTSLTTLESAVNTGSAIAHHFPVNNQAGACGILLNSVQDATIDSGSCSQNSGVRSFGIHVRTSDNLKIYRMNCCENIASGHVWWFGDSPTAAQIFGAATSATIPEQTAQESCLFGYSFGAGHQLNLQLAYENLLASLDFYSTFIVAQTPPCLGNANSIASAKTVASMYKFIWSTIAQYRRFCTALGIGVYNCNGATIDSCKAIGNSSLYDSAGGIALYSSSKSSGNCTNMGQCSCGVENSAVSSCTTGNNQAWIISARGGTGVPPTAGELNSYSINGAINIDEWLPLYTFLGVRKFVSRTGANDYVTTAITSPISATVNGFLAPQAAGSTVSDVQSVTIKGIVYSWSVNARKLWIGFSNPSTRLHDFSSPFPLASGILLECQRDCVVSENNAYGNRGNAGVGVGILADGALSTMFTDNKVSSNSADILGQAFGLADMELTTPNIWYQNWMYANRVDTYLNHSYLVVFDPAIVPGQCFPLTRVYQGDVSSLSAWLLFNNVEVYLTANRQISACVSESMSLEWLTASAAGYGLMS